MKKKHYQLRIATSAITAALLGMGLNAPSFAGPGGTYVHLFEWKWKDIKQECTYLAQKGYEAIQISPPSEDRVLFGGPADGGKYAPWWSRYQPPLASRSKAAAVRVLSW